MRLKKELGLIFLHYLRILSKIQLVKINLWRRLSGKRKIIVVGITGSAGKTSTMYATAAALKDDFKVKYSEKANSESGVPLNILGLKMKSYSLADWLRVAVFSPMMLLVNWRDYDIYIVEMGVDEPTEPKNMSYLLKIIQPQIGVFIGVGSVHSMQFGSLKAIADEKAKLIASLPEDGYAVLNPGDKFVGERKNLAKAKIIKAKRVKVNFDNYVLPEVYEINFGLAVAVASVLGIRLKKAIAMIKRNFRLPPGRSSLIKGIKNTLIIDSSYNASPKAMLAMLDLLQKQSRKLEQKKIAVLGDMRELGKLAAEKHRQIARRAAATADEIILVGPLMKKFALPILQKLKRPVFWYLTAGQAAKFLKKHLQGGELILVKGSQNTIFLEIIVETLMIDKNQAGSLLCRRGRFWEEKRKLYLNWRE